MQPNVSFRAESVGGTGNINFTNKANGIVVSGTGSIYMQSGGGGTGYITNVFNLTALGAGDNPAIANLPDHTVTTIGSGTPGAGTITLLGADGLTIAGNDARFAPDVRRSSAFVADWSGDKLAIGSNVLGVGLKPFEKR